MKKESRLLLDKAVNSLILSIEHFNRPWDQGRVEAVLIFLDHSFEMLLKSSILHMGGKIRDKKAKQTIGFDACVRKGLTDGNIKFLKEEQALQLQAINSLRDAAQHHLIDISEQHLYMHAQAGLTLFKDLMKSVFSKELQLHLPDRVLPLSTTPPIDLATLYDNEVKDIRRLLKPGKRRTVEAKAKLRALAIIDSAMKGENIQPDNSDLNRLSKSIKSGMNWDDLFPGVAAINLTAEGYGPSLDLRITKKEGIPVHLVPEGTPGATVVGVKRVSELDYYNLNLTKLAQKVGLTAPKTTAVVKHLDLKADSECFKEFTIGKTKFACYSQKAIQKIKEALQTTSIDDIWKKYRYGE